MNKILYAFITLLAMTSCANSYNIQGTSNVSTLDGRMLYLKILKNNDLKILIPVMLCMVNSILTEIWIL